MLVQVLKMQHREKPRGEQSQSTLLTLKHSVKENENSPPQHILLTYPVLQYTEGK